MAEEVAEPVGEEDGVGAEGREVGEESVGEVGGCGLSGGEGVVDVGGEDVHGGGGRMDGWKG